MSGLRTHRMGAFVLSLVVAASGCSSKNDDGAQSQVPSNAGGFAAGGGPGAGGQGTPGAGGATPGSGGSQTPPANGGSIAVQSGGASGLGTAGQNGGGMPGGGGASPGGASPGGASGTAGAGGGSAGAAGGGGTGVGGAVNQTLPPITDYSKPGPFKATTTANTGPSNGYTIFRPDPLGDKGFMHSPIIFGPGILTSASMYAAFLNHLATHGFVTICVNSMSGGPNDPANLKAMKDGLDWIIAQNTQSGVFQGKLAVDRAIGMGYSIGATASTQLSSDPAVMTTVSIHGHKTMGDPHGPELMLTGTMDVIDDNRTTLMTLTEAPAILMALPIGHLDVLTELAMTSAIGPNTRYIAPITAWLRYWVNGDQDAKSFFAGANCKMCSSPWSTPEPNDKWKALML